MICERRRAFVLHINIKGLISRKAAIKTYRVSFGERGRENCRSPVEESSEALRTVGSQKIKILIFISSSPISCLGQRNALDSSFRDISYEPDGQRPWLEDLFESGYPWHFS
jgi:hypothetical protein